MSCFSEQINMMMMKVHLHHTFTVSFQAQNSAVPQIFSTTVC